MIRAFPSMLLDGMADGLGSEGGGCRLESGISEQGDKMALGNAVLARKMLIFARMAAENKTDTVIISRVPPKKMLLVDDVPDLARAFETMLLKLGHTVEVSPDGKDALTRYKPGKYDLVITDYSMPLMNGVELAEIVKRRSAEQLILMVTAYTFTIAAYDGRPLPVDAILRKPFRPKEFNDTLVDLFLPKPADETPVAQPA